MHLIDLPKDVLLKVLSLSDWQDILMLEQTCCALKEIVASKTLWILLLGKLARQSCTPGLPKYIDIRQLDYLEIRSLVVRTLRWIKICKGAGEGHIPDSIGNKQIVHIGAPVDAADVLDMREPTSFRLALQGKLLFIGYQKQLRVYNVQKDTCVWTRMSLSSGSNSNFIGFALEEMSDSSIMIFVVSFDSKSNVMSFELFCLELDEENGTAIEHPVARNSSQRGSDENLRVSTLCLDGEFAALIVNNSQTRSAIVWNWKMEEQIDVIFEDMVSVNDIQIMHDHLFFALYSIAGGWKLEVLSLRKILGHIPVVHFSEVDRFSQDLSDALHDPSRGVFLTSGSNITLHNLSQYATADTVKVAIIATAVSESSQLGAYVACHYEVAIQTTEACNPIVGSIRCTQHLQHFLRHPDECLAETLAVSRSNGCIIDILLGILLSRNRDRSKTIHIYGFDELGKFYRTMYRGGSFPTMHPHEPHLSTAGAEHTDVDLGCFSFVNVLREGPVCDAIH
ncbi:uncharacterized protein FOMMEDRAFT_162008 [Fomitiporia mediterranea MF3/22]|uniref:uncharacterized protein n=1 Tax=Fomitiporia mediterranea (strain MF3/22) TaxID=694068 RepID=UPI0004408474|nr:uncharacterized protein FOMMEDRAFT_162008 [Fomitiporia mediterranea MF3/22]EJC98249.1 hypothetical protein FOMMEDRAFT_162008 [Fomitiporia mediterranea MF3/22]